MAKCDFIDLKMHLFQSTNIICVIHDTVQMGQKNDLSLTVHCHPQFFSEIRSQGAKPGGARLRLSINVYIRCCHQPHIRELRAHFLLGCDMLGSTN